MVMAMRNSLILLPLLLSATPAFAQAAPPSIQLPRELTDPEEQMRLAGKLQAISSAVMNIRIGDVSAALEGREATPRERNMTLGDLARQKDPTFDRDVAHAVATVGPKVQRSLQVLNRALPQVLSEADRLQRSVERAVSNLPDPNYPVR